MKNEKYDNTFIITKPTTIMRLLIIILCSFLLATNVHAQSLKKTIEKNGDTTYYTNEERLYTKSGNSHAIADVLKSAIYKSKYGFSILFSIQTGRTNNFYIENGANATLQLTDGTEIYLRKTTPTSRSRSSSLNYGSSVYSFYDLTAKARNQITALGIKSITIQSSLGELFYDLKEKFQKTIAEQVLSF